MDIHAQYQYMETLRTQYLKGSRKEKGNILDEYCRNTGRERKYAIKQFRYKVKRKETRKQRSVYYDGEVKTALVKVWEIFDLPCGQRLKPLIVDELQRLRTLKEVVCEEDVARKLTRISPATIDRKLNHEKEVRKFNLKHATKKNDTSLLNVVPIKTSADLDRSVPGNIQMDCVEHCGTSASGEYALSLTTVDIYSGWWEGEAFAGKGQEITLRAIDNARKRFPLSWLEMHPDNGSNLLNWHVHAYAKKERITYSRSRPYKKNDNCFAEQKNSTHVRKPFGYLRYDTPQEIKIMNDLYRNELRLFKNFFQPVMKLKEKRRVKGRIHRVYDTPKTPYVRVMKSGVLDKKGKEKLRHIYEELNPAALKRAIEEKTNRLYTLYANKMGIKETAKEKKLSVTLVSYYMIHR